MFKCQRLSLLLLQCAAIMSLLPFKRIFYSNLQLFLTIPSIIIRTPVIKHTPPIDYYQLDTLTAFYSRFFREKRVQELKYKYK